MGYIRKILSDRVNFHSFDFFALELCSPSARSHSKKQNKSTLKTKSKSTGLVKSLLFFLRSRMILL